MLDELLAGARARWSLDPAAGAQVVPADGLAGYPIEPSRLLVVLPAGGAPEPTSAIPGRHARRTSGDVAPLAVLRRLYPTEAPVLVGDREREA
ncbi:MAG TPA: hypothetical protein VFP19_02600, partial [Candidatus Limnocylindrales bacterium]|nr:hypothetical protein [Candidatus Limnocylindrales bacterium]